MHFDPFWQQRWPKDTLAHCSLETRKRVIDKHYRLRSDAGV